MIEINFYHQSKSLFFWSLFILSSSLEVIIVYPDNRGDTPEKNNSLSEFSLSNKASTDVDWHTCYYSEVKDCLEEFPNAVILLDLSTDYGNQYAISQLCLDNRLIHLSYQLFSKYSIQQSYSISSSLNEQQGALFSLLGYFNWTQGVAFINQKYLEAKKHFLSFSAEFKILSVETMTSFDDLVNREVSRLGATLYYVLLEPSESLFLQKSLQSAKLLIAGNGIILNQESGYGCELEGALIITEMGYENDLSFEEYVQHSIINTIGFISNTTSRGTYDEIRILLDSSMSTPNNKRNFSIVNIQKGKRKIVGSITHDGVIIFNNITFPGNAYSTPKSAKKVLHLSINAGTTNPGAQPSMTQKLGSMGAYACLKRINEGNDILPNFHTELFNFDCGVTIFNAAFAKSCFSHDIDKLGLAHLNSYGSGMAIGTMKTFAQLNISLPCIGSTNGDISLKSSQNYPMYVRTISSVTYIENIVLVKALGWKKAAILYENSSWGIASYSITQNTAKSVGLEIINSEKLRAIPPSLDRNSIKNHTDAFQGVIDSQARLFIMVFQCPMCNYALETFYDLGMRKGDIIIFTVTPDPLTYISINDTSLQKRLEIGHSMIRLITPSWLGDIGQDALKRIWAMYNIAPNTFGCNYYDGAYLVANALDFMINRGQDYTNPYKLMQALRVQRFASCTGYVQIEQNSNDRIFDLYQFEVANVNQAQGTANISLVGTLKPFSTQLLYFEKPLIYPDGTTIKPPDLRVTDGKCPFPENKIQTFAKGRILLFGICFTMALIAGIITFLIRKKWWNERINDLVERQEVSLQDFIVAATIVIEAFQFASMGPDFQALISLLSQLSQAISFDLNDFIEFKNGFFWIIADIVLGSIGLWVILCTVVLLRLHEIYDNIWIFRNLGILSEYLIPILGNLCFIPFISICLEMFQCDQSIGDDFTDSFLAKDCYYFCWKDEHLIYALLSIVALLLYQPLAVFFRPVWQELQLNLHVKALPIYLMVKSIVQMMLITLNKTLKRASDISHGIVFIVIMTAYVWYILKYNAFNYGRFNFWQALSLIVVIWLALLSVILLSAGGNSIVYITILIVGWAMIGLVGILIQKKKYPSLLYKKKPRNESALFSFAFNFSLKSSIYLIDD
ncbi:unnamed protein product [Blepharisma stoltei]|uniref:Receptor ligand binding region domain-containing protein n=1 Tax=Blepharisma stoltei TaxID=1481888 RepID=A0AAU9JEG3_9CILI|nr:unnamed protein product [Blepharisma stoltei]